MRKTKLDETNIYIKSALKCDSFDVAIDTKIPFFRVSVTIEPSRSILTLRYHKLFDYNFSGQHWMAVIVFS